MGEPGAPVDQVQDATASDATASAQLQPFQQRTVAGDESEAAVRGPGHAGKADTAHTRGSDCLDRGRALRSAPHQPRQDGSQRCVRSHEGRLTEADLGPEDGLPDQSPQPRACGSQLREVTGSTDVCQDPGQEAVIE